MPSTPNATGTYPSLSCQERPSIVPEPRIPKEILENRQSNFRPGPTFHSWLPPHPDTYKMSL